MIELARHHGVENFVYASSSSVYGGNTKLPFSETDRVDSPISLYAATKRSNELTAHCYSHLFGLHCSGLRFFTVYGPWGRPDMALFKFTKAILAGEPIEVYNQGKMKRNFTYIDDIVQGVCLTLRHPVPYELYNIGNSRAEDLLDFIHEIEKNCGKKALVEFLPMQPGDVPSTVADISKLAKLGYSPTTNIDAGIRNFTSWYREYYHA
jgi:UDP-glucuronate 4-epimerase